MEFGTVVRLDELLNFEYDVGEDENNLKNHNNLPQKRQNVPAAPPSYSNYPVRSSPEEDDAEEELEWISNKDAFPSVETFVDVMPEAIPKQHSPVSVLENTTFSGNSSSSEKISNGSINIMNYCSSLHVPVRRARSKCHKRRPREFSKHQFLWVGHGIEKNPKHKMETLTNVRRCQRCDSDKTSQWRVTANGRGTLCDACGMQQQMGERSSTGRKCQHCGSEKTPQWRAGPRGPKTLCNACGVRFKSGRLVPEYRPASSPTFSSELHSNSHRKVVEMRKMKQTMGVFIVNPVDIGG